MLGAAPVIFYGRPMNTFKMASAVVALAATAGLSACGSSGASSNAAAAGSPTATATKPTLSQRVAAARACGPVLKPLSGAVPILQGVATQKIAPADAVKQLTPLEQAVQKAAAANASSPAAPALNKLSSDITALQSNPPKDPGSIKTAATGLLTDVRTLTAACMGH